MTKFCLLKTPQRKLCKKINTFKTKLRSKMLRPLILRATTSPESISAEEYNFINTPVSTPSCPSPFCVAFQHIDSNDDAVVITTVTFPKGAPFDSHQDLIKMSPTSLATLANMLNEKLPKALEIDTSVPNHDLRSQIEKLAGIRQLEPTLDGQTEVAVYTNEEILDDVQSYISAKSDDEICALPPSPLAHRSRSLDVGELKSNPGPKVRKARPSCLSRLEGVEESPDDEGRPVKRRKTSGLESKVRSGMSPSPQLPSASLIRSSLPLYRSQSSQEKSSPRHTFAARRSYSLKLRKEIDPDTAFIAATQPKYRVKRAAERAKEASPPALPANTPETFGEPMELDAKMPIHTKAGTIMLDIDTVLRIQQAFPGTLSPSTATPNNTPIIHSMRSFETSSSNHVVAVPNPSTIASAISRARSATLPNDSYISVFAFSAPTRRYRSPPRRSQTLPLSTPGNRYIPTASSPLAVYPPVSLHAVLDEPENSTDMDLDEELGIGRKFLHTPFSYLSEEENVSVDSVSPTSSLSFDENEGYGNDVFGGKTFINDKRKKTAGVGKRRKASGYVKKRK